MLKPKVFLQQEVVVTSEKKNLSAVMQKINEKDLDKIPNLYSDVIRSVKILPGVTSIMSEHIMLEAVILTRT